MALIPYAHLPPPHDPPILVAEQPLEEYYCGDARCDCATANVMFAGVPLVIDLGTTRVDFHNEREGQTTSAREALRTGSTSAVYLFDPAGTADRLLVASGGGTAVSGAVQQVFTKVTAAQQRTVAVDDVVPLLPGDGRGMSGFYLVIGWVVGGYLFASLLGIAKGSRPATFPRVFWRLGITVPYALLSGLGGAVVAEPVLHAMNGHFWSIAGIGTLVTLSATTVTIALQTLFGVIGIGLTVIIFVILGNPSAGGAYQPSVLPPFWRAISSYLPNGAGTEAIRRIVYFDGHAITHPIVVLICWIVGGVLVTLAGAAALHRGAKARA